MKLIFKKFGFHTFTMEEFIAIFQEGAGKHCNGGGQEWLERKDVSVITLKHNLQESNKDISSSVFLRRSKIFTLTS